jgi:two-component system chemotaxis response regulator CheY
MELEPSLRVLVVEDSSTMRNIIKSALHDLDITNVIEAEDGDKALEILEGSEVDLVLCDWKMPCCSGMEVLQAIRAKPELEKLPFIMVTAEAQKDNVVSAIKEGVSNYIIKPFDSKLLKEKIEKVLSTKT